MGCFLRRCDGQLSAFFFDYSAVNVDFDVSD